MSKMSDIAKAINRKYKDNNMIITADMTPKFERLSTGSLGFDMPLAGGLVEGAITLFSGVEHSGKTTAAVNVIAAYQRKYPKKKCLYIDVEAAMDWEFQAKMNHVDLSKLITLTPDGTMSAEEILNVVEEFQETDDIGVIVVDTVTAMTSQYDLGSDLTKDSGFRGSIANTLHRHLKFMAQRVKAKKNIYILISQVRVSKAFNGATIYHEPGGTSLGHYPSTKIRFGARQLINADGKRIANSSYGEEAGFRLNFVTTKQKTAFGNYGGFITYNNETGVDIVSDAITIGIDYGFIKRPTTQRYELVNLDTGEYYLDEKGKTLSFVGEAKLRAFLDKNKEFRDEFVGMIIKHVSGQKTAKSLLEQDLIDEIISEQ